MQRGNAPPRAARHRARARPRRPRRGDDPAARRRAARPRQPGRPAATAADRGAGLRPRDTLHAPSASRHGRAPALAGGERPRRVLGLVPLREVGPRPGVAARREPRARLAPRRLRARRPARRRGAHPPAARAGQRRQPAGAGAADGRRGADLGLRLLGRRDDGVRALPPLLHEGRPAAPPHRQDRRPPRPRAHRDDAGGRAGSHELLEPGPVSGRHTRWMRRGAALALLLGLAVLGAGWLAIGAAGDDRPAVRHVAAAPAEAPAETAKLPPLPAQMRPKVVDPKAGAVATPSRAPAEEDTRLDDPGPKPTRAASHGGRPLDGVLAGAGGGVTQATALANGVALPPLEAPEAGKKIIEA